MIASVTAPNLEAPASSLRDLGLAAVWTGASRRTRAGVSCIVTRSVVHELTHLIDLASVRLGARAIAANDEFFAEKENLLTPEPAIWLGDKYTDRGKWMDGWETRRRRTAGHDWCIVKLGVPGVIHSVIVDTSFFRGNYPSHCSVDACGLPDGADATEAGVVWHPILPQTELAGDTKNTLTIDRSPRLERRFTHARLNIFPDGGVARLRVLGEVLPDWSRVLAGGGEIDLVAVVHGGYVVDASDRFFGEPHNMLMPWAPSRMADGWETKRRRGPGHDWAVIRLGIAGAVQRAEIDTAFFKGNYPDSASIEAAVVPDEGGGNVSADVSSKAIANWHTVLGQTRLDADRRHAFDLSHLTASHVRLNIYPDGGISRFRLSGLPDANARRLAVVRQLNATDEPALRALLTDFCGAPEWLDRVAAARPFTSPAAVLTASEDAAASVTPAGWREAFRHHPGIGERTAGTAQSAGAQRASALEQAGVRQAAPEDLSALAEGNRAYESRFGQPFVVFVSGKSVPEMIAILRERLNNDPETELRVAAGEQQKITRRRLSRLLE